MRAPLAFSLMFFLLSVPPALPSLAQAGLPPQVQSDLLVLRIENALTAGQGPQALDLVEALKVVPVTQPDGLLAMLEARAAIAAGDTVRAEAVLSSHLQSATPGTEDYQQALELMSETLALRQRQHTQLLAEAGRAIALGDLDAAEQLYQTVAAVAERRTPIYFQALQGLSDIPGRRLVLAAEQAHARSVAAEVAERANSVERHAEAERALYRSVSTIRADVRLLRWILNRHFSPAQDATRPPANDTAPELTSAERDALVRFRQRNDLLGDLPAPALRYLDTSVLEAVRAHPWVPVVTSYAAQQGYAEHSDWLIFRDPVNADDGRPICLALTRATAYAPGPFYAVPEFAVATIGGSVREFFIGMTFTPGSEVIFDVDGRRFATTSDANGEFRYLSPDNSATSDTRLRALLAGSQLTISGTLATTGETATLGFSLIGHTRALRAAIALCNG